jgi:phosphate starvation-inducible protein PhoH and related proteins
MVAQYLFERYLMTNLNSSAKKTPKNPIRFLVNLNEEQKQAKQVILNNKITVIKGQAGSGKSLVAAQVALDLLFRREVEKVILTRPAVTSGEEIGFLPGSKEDKLAPYTAAIYDNMYRLYNKEKIDKCVLEGQIEVIPLAFMRGRNLTNCCVVVDEGQNITHRQMELLLGRICKDTKMIICGDIQQIDLKDKKISGFNFICTNFKEVPGFEVVVLKTNHRDPIVEQILEIYKAHD